jgi:hypothetical protein
MTEYIYPYLFADDQVLLVEDENAVPALYLIMIIQHYSVLIFMKKV